MIAQVHIISERRKQARPRYLKKDYSLDLTGLNPQQKEAVTQINGPVMVLAGAGTGKTKVITSRIAHMVKSGVEPDRIAAMTFTNKAAKEMKDRVKLLIGTEARKCNIGTFHSFCIKLLKIFHNECCLPIRFSLAGTSDQLDLVRRALDEKGWGGDYKAEELLNRISKAKNALLLPNQVELAPKEHFSDEDPALLSQVYSLYERQLGLNNAIDFDDCILKVATVLKENSDVLNKVQHLFTHILVDEFQDTNFAQLSILEMIGKKSHNVCVVGDDDQSIYSWRGAMVETLDRFEQSFPSTNLIKLEQNYRCSNVILEAANNLIKNNSGRKGKTLWSQSDSQEYISLASKQTDVEEARWIAQKCYGLLGQGLQLRDIGILFRANSQAGALETALRERNLNYKVYGGTSFFERKEVRDFLAYFKLTINPSDTLSLWRVINTPSRGIGIKTLEKISNKAQELDITPYQVLKAHLVPLPHLTQIQIDLFIKNLEEQRSKELNNIVDIEKRGESIIESFHLINDIKTKTKHEGSRKRKVESMKNLPKWLSSLAANQAEDSGEINLPDLLDFLMLSDDKASQKEDNFSNHISLMTIHGSKGLEFPAVFICGVEEGLLPHKNSVESESAVQEERRLFYVAITRAKQKLHISYSRERYSNFQRQDRKPSRFLEELPKSLLVTDTLKSMSGVATEGERKNRNIKRLGSLKEKLKTGWKG